MSPHSDPHSLPCSSQRPRPHCASSLRKPRAGSSTGGTSRAVFTLCCLLAQPWPCSPTSPRPSSDRQGPCPPGSWAPGAPLPQPAAAGSALRSNPPGEEQSQGLRHKCWGQISSPGGTGTSSRGAAAAASRTGRSAGRGQENPQQRAQCTARTSREPPWPELGTFSPSCIQQGEGRSHHSGDADPAPPPVLHPHPFSSLGCCFSRPVPPPPKHGQGPQKPDAHPVFRGARYPLHTPRSRSAAPEAEGLSPSPALPRA